METVVFSVAFLAGVFLTGIISFFNPFNKEELKKYLFFFILIILSSGLVVFFSFAEMGEVNINIHVLVNTIVYTSFVFISTIFTYYFRERVSTSINKFSIFLVTMTLMYFSLTRFGVESFLPIFFMIALLFQIWMIFKKMNGSTYVFHVFLFIIFTILNAFYFNAQDAIGVETNLINGLAIGALSFGAFTKFILLVLTIPVADNHSKDSKHQAKEASRCYINELGKNYFKSTHGIWIPFTISSIIFIFGYINFINGYVPEPVFVTILIVFIALTNPKKKSV